jgi:hypothetical protein
MADVDGAEFGLRVTTTWGFKAIRIVKSTGCTFPEGLSALQADSR